MAQKWSAAITFNWIHQSWQQHGDVTAGLVFISNAVK